MWTPNLAKFTDMQAEVPIIVGGSSGSGTRILVWMLQAMGVYMGYRDYTEFVHPAADSIPMAWWLLSNHVAWLLGGEDLGEEKFDKAKFALGFQAALDLHLAHKQKHQKMWGWKNPPNLDLIDFYHMMFPKMKFIHMVRDGRDHSDMWIQTMVRKQYIHCIPEAMRQNPDEVNWMWLWDLLNSRVKQYGETEMGPEQYKMVKLEDVTEAPDEIGEQLREWVGAEYYYKHVIPSVIKPPKTIGRHKVDFEPDTAANMTVAGKNLLIDAGYIRKKEAQMDLNEVSPVVIGGFGGSGTRVPVLYLLALGVNMQWDDITYKGKNPYDKMAQFGFKWANDALNFDVDVEHIKDIIATMTVDTTKPWGWKTPPAFLYLPTLHKLIPNMKFIHVIRDPRDIDRAAMAIWVNMYIDPKEEDEHRGTQKFIKWWCKQTKRIHEYGTKHMGDNYMMVKLEDILPREKDTLKLFADFMGIPGKITSRKKWNEITTKYEIGTRVKDRKVSDKILKKLKEWGYEA